MSEADRLQNISVLGAAGKMGSGIVLLTAVQLADRSLLPENKTRSYVLNAFDVSHEALSGLMNYLNAQVRKAAEKKTSLLRKFYAERKDLVENGEIIDQYVFDVLNIVRPTTSIQPVYSSGLVFEAVSEKPELKVRLFSDIRANSTESPWFFTNTSSVPISELDEKAGLGGSIIGFHFYNPPAVQKLVEMIPAKTTKPELKEFALGLAKELRKKIVPSNDIAGFIGNGHFMRDALHGISEVERLSKDMPFAEAVYMVNRVSQDFLVRPMGIFQLVDYVGIDVCRCIMEVMNPHADGEDLHSDLLDRIAGQSVLGGQYANGSQKDGFLKYVKGRPSAVYDPDKKEYVLLSDFQEACDNKLGPLPESALPWKAVISNPKAAESLPTYFQDLKKLGTAGADLAMRYGNRSKQIGQKLVSDKVAETAEDVNTVLLTGFFHAYGPINDFFE